MRVTRLLSAALSLGLLAVLVAGCNSGPTGKSSGPGPAAGGTKRILILTNGESPFWDACRQGLETAEKDLNLSQAGLTAALEVNNGTEEGQLERLRQYASQSDIAAIGVSVTKEDNAAIADQLRQLKQKGIHVLTIDSDVNRAKFRDARTAYVGTDNIQAGRELGKCAKMLRPNGGEYVSFVGFTTAQNAKERVQGFAEGAGDKFVSKDNMGDELDRVRAKENVRNALINHPKLNLLVGIWSYNAPAIVNVVEEEKKRDKVAIVTFDAEPQAIERMSDGWIDAMAVQNPYMMGYESVRLMKALAQMDQKAVKEMLPKMGDAGGDLFDTGIRIVVPDTNSPLKPEMFETKDKNVKGYTLTQFKEWLEKYNLKQS
jgi:ribose transport system substrate-binding protein